jgi:hypothetical protein
MGVNASPKTNYFSSQSRSPGGLTKPRFINILDSETRRGNLSTSNSPTRARLFGVEVRVCCFYHCSRHTHTHTLPINQFEAPAFFRAGTAPPRHATAMACRAEAKSQAAEPFAGRPRSCADCQEATPIAEPGNEGGVRNCPPQPIVQLLNWLWGACLPSIPTY